jgi:hypothetical protein
MAAKARVMYWQSAMIDRWIGHDVLRRSAAAAFSFDPARVDVTDDVMSLTGPIPPEPRMLLERVEREGPFPLQLDIFLGGDFLEAQVTDLNGTLKRARAIAHNLGAVMLLGDGPIGHDEQLRVSPDGTVDIVELDGDEMDEDRFVIIGARPFVEQPAEATRTAIG